MLFEYTSAYLDANKKYTIEMVHSSLYQNMQLVSPPPCLNSLRPCVPPRGDLPVNIMHSALVNLAESCLRIVLSYQTTPSAPPPNDKAPPSPSYPSS